MRYAKVLFVELQYSLNFVLFNVRHINVTAKDTALMIIVGYPLPLALANGHEIFILLGL